MVNNNNLNLIRGGNTIFWKNNILYTFFFSKLFFQINLVKKIIKIFFLKFFFSFWKKKRKIFILLSQIWLNSLNSNIFISLNFCYQITQLSISYNVINENYLRFRYFYYLELQDRFF